MRRGTEAAQAFGELLYKLRTNKKLTMRDVAKKLGVQPAAISDFEKAKRAVKEPKLDALASALEVDKWWFRDQWKFLQEEFPDSGIRRYRARSSTTKELYEIFDKLTAPERERVIGYSQRLIEERKS